MVPFLLALLVATFAFAFPASAGPSEHPELVATWVYTGDRCNPCEMTITGIEKKKVVGSYTVSGSAVPFSASLDKTFGKLYLEADIGTEGAKINVSHQDGRLQGTWTKGGYRFPVTYTKKAAITATKE